MHPLSTLVYLERPWTDATDVEAAVLGAAFLMGLRSPGGYWVELAMQWAELGFPMTDEAVDELRRIEAGSPKKFPQKIRHRAAALLRKVVAGVVARKISTADDFSAR